MNYMKIHPGIRIDKIDAEGFPGLLFVLATALIVLSIPALRVFFLASLSLGIVGSVLLHYYHRWF